MNNIFGLDPACSVPADTRSRGRVWLAAIIGCGLSPCSLPLLVPIVATLAAGTPLALWLGANFGLIVGVSTLASAAAFLLAWRWWRAAQ